AMIEWLYGRHAVEEALRAGRRKVLRVLLADGNSGAPRQAKGERLSTIESLARTARVSIERVPTTRLDALTRVGHHHQGVAAEVSPFPYASLADVEALCRQAGERAL